MGKNKKEDDNFLRKKNRRKTKQCYHGDTCRWNTDSFSSEAEITKGIVWIKIFKKKYFYKRPKEFDWDKPPD